MVALAVSQLSGLLGWCGTQLGWSMSSGVHSKEGSARMWKALTYFIARLGVGVSMLNVFLKSHHGEHQVHCLPYFHIRFKPFPWGDDNHSLFHSSHVNLLPTSYEDE
ncbi:unnamed protein product [Nyctereutes procyonoides]|uniref:(raccoon dog) hypothetical protein n=1 Tax=Nyctereutes procyonoides TaxID=34880 RepID=A0A811XRH0_NYCPR|nr:cytochrome c oxidase subunit 6A1, mitochondrial-like [Nyctereutes procyonoides]CAD7667388.1 unnamed protein product [Nyctereutes procyonoides]